MSKEFYKYIAKHIISFFKANETSLHSGDRFFLKLDNQRMVDELNVVLQEEMLAQSITDTWVYKENVYQTYAMRLNSLKIAIISKTSDMTEDFLATLRNARETMLMITAAPIDSIKKGAGDLSAQGMPFHKDAIRQDVNKYINSSVLSSSDKAVLRFELERRAQDIFSDKTSLFEYESLLSILSNEKVVPSDFPEFRLLYDDELPANASEVDYSKRLKKNNEWFERIDRSMRVGNIEHDFEKDLDTVLIKKLIQLQKKPNEWDTKVTYSELLRSYQKKHDAKEKTFEIVSCFAYAGIPIENTVFEENVTLFTRADGNTAAQQRKKNILVFNPDRHEDLHIEFEFNRVVKNSNVASIKTAATASGKTVKCQLSHTAGTTSFHSVKIGDENSSVKYEFRICVVDVLADYLQSIISSYSLAVKKSGGSLRVLRGVDDIVINSGREIVATHLVEEGSTYSCNFSEGICLHIDESSLSIESKDGLHINLELGGVIVPISIMDEPKVKAPITGLQVLKKKHAQKHALALVGSNAIISGTDEFFAREDYRQNLLFEQQFVTDGIYCATLSNNTLQPQFFDLPGTVRDAYDDFLFHLRNRGLVPSLAFYDDELSKCAQAYIDAVKAILHNLADGQPILAQINNILKLGTIEADGDGKEIFFTPLHPLNVMYQLALRNEVNIGDVRNELAVRLKAAALLPYIRSENGAIYRVVEQQHSPEWTYYAPLSNPKYSGSRAFVPKLVAEKIREYIDHFSCLFERIQNKTFLLNVINMGDCQEVFLGMVQYIARSLQHNPDPDDLFEFVINVYCETPAENYFQFLSDYTKLQEVISSFAVKFPANFSPFEIANIITSKFKCFFRSLSDSKYEYAHIALYEMGSSSSSSIATSDAIDTGMMLEGLISGVPSVFYGQEYKTGFGMKFSKETSLTQFANHLNSMYQVAYTSNPYHEGQCISTAVEKASSQRRTRIYEASNWVTFVDPKVDLNFFQNDSNPDVLIIHYSDQYTTSSGYDAITVTQKSKQYENIIGEYLHQNGITTTANTIHHLIDMFNAINGDWLLRLISSRSQFPREKMSILSAIKVALAYYQMDGVVWVPLSLEELLRVSGATGLSASDGLLSAKNLQFDSGETSDDILLIGVSADGEHIRVYFHPIEVKIGFTDTMLAKAKVQVTNTATNLLKALNPDTGYNDLQNKIIRNYIMQALVVAAQKMKLYHIWDAQNWDAILCNYRTDLLNDNYRISSSLDSVIGKGTVITFNHDAALRKTHMDGDLEIIELPEHDGTDFMLKQVPDVRESLMGRNDTLTVRINEILPDASNPDPMEKSGQHASAQNVGDGTPATSTDVIDPPLATSEGADTPTGTQDTTEAEAPLDVTDEEDNHKGIMITFGLDQGSGKPLIWEPGNTNKILHPNTGIIGTMGTGKTQFTKSLITQLYRETKYNVGANPIGILIFDYKGDYNETKADFVSSTNAKILKLYHLPYNPLALTRPKSPKPLLPIHVANAFKDTLSKVYGFGPKQENTLFNCIKDAYAAKGIKPADESTWSNCPPTFSDVYRIYANDDEIKKNDSLAAALDKLADFEIFESDPYKTESLFDILNGVVVVDLSGYDSDIQNLVVAITLDLFYAQMQAQGSSKLEGPYRQLSKMILVDEADNFLHEGFPSLKKILKEGREFGIGTILSTQFLKHFGSGDDDFSKYILTWVVHNVSDLKPTDIRFVFNTEANCLQEQKLFNDVKKLEKHYSIVKVGNAASPIYMRDLAFWELISQ